jgi:hypothetical protein
MLSKTPSAASVAAVLLLGSLSLAGCSSASHSTITHTAALNTSGGRDTARSGVQSAILVADTTNGIALPGGPTPAGIARRVLAMLRGGRRTLAGGISTGTCNNGVKQSAVTNADGSQTTTTDYYFEPACTTLEVEASISLTTPATPGDTTGNGTITSYDRSGAVHVVESLTITAATDVGETVTVSGTAASKAGGTVTSGFGATCSGTPPSATVTCSVAHWGTSAGSVSPGTVTGEAIATGATAGTGGANNTATVAISLFAGTTLGVGETGTTWGVTGVAAFNTAAGTYSYTSSGPAGTGTLSGLKDGLYTYTETATYASTGITVTIIENPNGIVTADTPIATAAIDAAGTGVLSYADGSSEPIAGGLIGY